MYFSNIVTAQNYYICFDKIRIYIAWKYSFDYVRKSYKKRSVRCIVEQNVFFVYLCLFRILDILE